MFLVLHTFTVFVIYGLQQCIDGRIFKQQNNNQVDNSSDYALILCNLIHYYDVSLLLLNSKFIPSQCDSLCISTRTSGSLHFPCLLDLQTAYSVWPQVQTLSYVIQEDVKLRFALMTATVFCFILIIDVGFRQ
jgi:hypothetical protein